ENCPLTEPRQNREKSAIYMNGREVFKFAVGEVPKIMAATIERAGLDPSKDIDFYVLHQANDRIMTAMAERMNVDPAKIHVSLEKYGNTSAASIPLALYDGLMAGDIRPGHRLVLC